MGDDEFTLKIDVLDLLIATLKEHEKALSALVDRAEEVMVKAEKYVMLEDEVEEAS